MDGTVELMRELGLESGIPAGWEVYAAIMEALLLLVPSLALFTYESREHSHCARSQKDGSTRTCAIISLYLRHDDDLAATRVDPHMGNWRDKWKATAAIRTTFNRVLAEHGYDEAMRDEQSFVFPSSLEERSFRRLGREAKKDIPGLLARIAGAACTEIFWISDVRTYFLRVDHDAERRMVDKMMPAIGKAISDLLRRLDGDARCRRHDVTIETINSHTNTFHLYREDC